MGSMSSNPNTWAPYDAYRDCSQQICSIYCPQWCYMIFSPPPPPDDDSATNLSPLIIALIGILASAFLLVSYYAVISKYCKRRDDQNPSPESEANGDHPNRDPWQVGPAGLDEVLIKSIAVCKYKKGDGLVEGTDCAVCLSEFGEDESLRLLPNCSHAFHLPCIDTWLKSHSNCPLCRSTVAYSNAAAPSQPPFPQTSSAVNISSLETQRGDAVVLVVDDPEMGRQEEAAVGGGDVRLLVSKNGGEAQGGTNSERRDDVVGTEEVGVQQFRRSISLGSFGSQRQLLIADILRIGEEDDANGHWIVDRGENSKRHGGGGGGGRRGLDSADCPTTGLKRSVSTGRFMFTGHDDKGKISIIPT